MAKITPSAELWKRFESSQELSKTINNVIVVLMMGTLGIGIMHLGARLSEGWRGGYVVWLLVFIAIEAIATRTRTRELDTRERVLFHLSEWVAFAVLIKLLQYLVRDPAQLLRDIPAWQRDFASNFLTGEYMLILGMSLIVWFLCRSYAGEFEALYEREQDAKWDEVGKLQNALRDFRNRIASRVFIVGTFVVILSVMSRLDADYLRRFAGYRPPSYTAPVANVLAYFILAMVMLSQTQFALLRTRWLSQRVRVHEGLARGWLKYSALFFLLLAIIAFFLPTEYTVGLFDVLRFALDFILRAATLLFTLLMLPLTACMSLFSFQQETVQQPPPPFEFSPPPAVTPSAPVPWWEMVRAVLFWAIFLAIIIFAVRYYLLQNKTFLAALRRVPVLRWIGGALSGLWRWLRGANRQVAQLVRRGVQRLRPKTRPEPFQAIRRLFRPGPLTARDRVIQYYVSLVELAGAQGLRRRPGETPYQYQQDLHEAVPDIDEDVHGLTETFLEARYSLHEVEEPKAQTAGSLWERIKEKLKNLRKQTP